ncbi:hypothetical protein HJC23_001264 [Cyclotella cryptica]|uniref:Uncharacterized protein n=1 Tax=Cyclotella cryptica TaxID=29204 RepID=A0ABD3PDP2_9STRA
MASVDCTSDAFPFVFYDDAGAPVDGVVNDQGICTFPTSSCGEGLPGCCAPKPYTTGTYYMFIAFAVIFIPKFFIRVYFKEIRERDPTLIEDVKFGKKPGWMNSGLLKYVAWMWDFGIWVGVTVLIIMPIFMKPSIQKNLTVSSRTALQSAEAFLVPYKEIFQFVEDIISIRINYALSRGDKVAANSLTHLGIAGALMTGLIASGFASVLGAIPPVLQALTNPGMKSDLALYPGCAIIEEAADSHDLIFNYWMIEVWKFPGTQVTMVLSGFMYGALEYNLAGWIMAIGWSMLPLIWFLNLSKAIEPLILLALGEFTVPYCMLLLSLLYLVSPLGKSIREFTGVELSISQLRTSFGDLFCRGHKNGDSPSESTLQASLLSESEGVQEGQVPQNDDSERESSAGGLIREGLCIMFLDVAVQMAKTLAIYMALKTDAATAYQLTALDSELPSYGIAYTTGMAFMFKILGPIFLTIEEYGYFFKMARVYLICAFLLIPLIIGSTSPFLDGLALRSGQVSTVTSMYSIFFHCFIYLCSSRLASMFFPIFTRMHVNMLTAMNVPLSSQMFMGQMQPEVHSLFSIPIAFSALALLLNVST